MFQFLCNLTEEEFTAKILYFCWYRSSYKIL